MTSLLFGITLSALLSLTSFLTVLLRVSPITSPSQAIPAFLSSALLTVATCGTLLFYVVWKVVPVHSWDEGRLLSIALRQGVFFGTATTLILIFHLLELLNWWIAILMYVVFILIELALEH